ncbi:hypothetical protein [Bacillus sp. FJAT-52991]|uniref:Uncharacterized protein n=1 Tax=Bacillus kandeliae TaxID=3129297 RepID=A0ABZ2N2J7_9BACI
MDIEQDHTDFVIFLLDTITILIVEDNPVVGIALVALLKILTEDKIIRISLILLIIALAITKTE